MPPVISFLLSPFQECLLRSVQVTPNCPTRITGVIPSFTLRHVVFEYKKKQLQRKLAEAGLPQTGVAPTVSPFALSPAFWPYG